MQEQTVQNKPVFSARWIVVGSIIVSLVIIVLLFISWWMAYAAEQQQLSRLHVEVKPKAGVALDVTYPQYLLLDSEPVPLQLDLQMTDSRLLTEPLTVTLDVPPSITADAREVVFVEGDGRFQSCEGDFAHPFEFWAKTCLI